MVMSTTIALWMARAQDHGVPLQFVETEVWLIMQCRGSFVLRIVHPRANYLVTISLGSTIFLLFCQLTETILRTCQTRQDLLRLVDVMFDRSQTNPDIIANTLSEMGCPFSCQYVSHSATLTMKRNDPRIGNNHVRLDFELSDIVGEGQEVIISDIDVTLDMFISDIGTAFGLLLGTYLIIMVLISIKQT